MVLKTAEPGKEVWAEGGREGGGAHIRLPMPNTLISRTDLIRMLNLCT